MQVSLSDEEVIRQYLPTQPDHCFEALYNRYVKKVYQRCLSMTKDSEKAQDFTHDIFLKVFHKLDGFQQRSTFSTWIYSITYNYCADQLRIAKRLPTTALEENITSYTTDPLEARLQEETIQVMQQVIGRLSDKERELLQLRYEEGLSIDQIAETYQIKPNAVKMRLKRTRDRIKYLCAIQYASQAD